MLGIRRFDLDDFVAVFENGKSIRIPVNGKLARQLTHSFHRTMNHMIMRMFDYRTSFHDIHKIIHNPRGSRDAFQETVELADPDLVQKTNAYLDRIKDQNTSLQDKLKKQNVLFLFG